jgi:hypothetical protein
MHNEQQPIEPDQETIENSGPTQAEIDEWRSYPATRYLLARGPVEVVSKGVTLLPDKENSNPGSST